MTDSTDRGITINKALAWTMLVTVAGLLWWGGGRKAQRTPFVSSSNGSHRINRGVRSDLVTPR